MSTRRDPRGRFAAMRDSQISTALSSNRQVAFNMGPTPASHSRPQPGLNPNVPYLLQGAEGNMMWRDGEIMEDAAGAAAIAFAAINVLDCITKYDGDITDRDFDVIKELVEFIRPDTMNTFRKGFADFKLLQQITPSGGLSNSFLPKEEGTRLQPVKRSLSPSALAEPPRKRSRLLEKLEAEDESDSEIDGEKTQALLPHYVEAARVLEKFHESLIYAGRSSVTIAKSMDYWAYIPSNAVLCIDLGVLYITGEGAEAALTAVSSCAHLDRLKK